MVPCIIWSEICKLHAFRFPGPSVVGASFWRVLHRHWNYWSDRSTAYGKEACKFLYVLRDMLALTKCIAKHSFDPEANKLAIRPTTWGETMFGV